MGEWNKWVGEQYFEPWAESIRVYFEGADAIRLPVTDRRVLLTRTWDMPMEDVLIVGLCVVFITALSVFFDSLVFIVRYISFFFVLNPLLTLLAYC